MIETGLYNMIKYTVNSSTNVVLTIMTPQYNSKLLTRKYTSLEYSFIVGNIHGG